MRTHHGQPISPERSREPAVGGPAAAPWRGARSAVAQSTPRRPKRSRSLARSAGPTAASSTKTSTPRTSGPARTTGRAEGPPRIPGREPAMTDHPLDDAPLSAFHKKLALYSSGGPFLGGYILSIIGVALVQITPQLNLNGTEQGL